MSTSITSCKFPIRSILLAILLVVVACVCLYFYFCPILATYVLPQRIASAQVDVGDPLLAVKSLDVDGAAVELKEGEFAVKVSDKTLRISVGKNAKITVLKLKLELSVADSKNQGKKAVSVELTEADLATEGEVSVSYNNLPHVPIEKVSIKAAEGQAPEVTAQLLFAKVIASILADALHAPLAQSDPASSDVQSRTKSATIQTATLALRPHGLLRLPKSYALTLGDAPTIRVSNVAYSREPAETFSGLADLDLSVAPPTQLAIEPVMLRKIGGRIQLAIDLSLQRRAFTATLNEQDGNENKCDLTSGEMAYSAAAATIKSAALKFDSLAYDSTKQKGGFSFAGTLDTTTDAKWTESGLNASATVTAKCIKLQSKDAGQEGLKLVATVDQPLSIENVVVARKTSNDELRLTLEKTSFTGSLDNLLDTETYIKNFKTSGGKITYNSGGLIADATFLASASLEWHDRQPGQSNGSSDFSVSGKAKRLVLSRPDIGEITFPELDIDVRSKPGNEPGMVVNCKSNFSLKSNAVAIANSEIVIHSLTMQSDKNGKVSGSGSAELSLPKVQLSEAIDGAIKKEFNIPDGSVGRLLVFDGRITGCKVDARGLSSGFNGVELHIQGNISAGGRLTLSRRIVITFPIRIDRTIVDHKDFSISAKMKGGAIVTFPAAPELLQQKTDLDIHLDHPEDLQLHVSDVQFIATLLQAINSVFHFDAKIIDGLPKRVSLSLFDANKVEQSSILRRVHNPKISIADGANALTLRVDVSVDF